MNPGPGDTCSTCSTFHCVSQICVTTPPLQIFIFHSVTIILPEDFTQCTTRGSFLTRWHETAYNMFTFSCLFLLPLVIMITCYTRIFFEISKRVKKDNRKSDRRDRCAPEENPLARARHTITHYFRSTYSCDLQHLPWKQQIKPVAVLNPRGLFTKVLLYEFRLIATSRGLKALEDRLSMPLSVY